uniref:Nudix hydrolase domain-containing protein n=1 Tax=Globodera rostochiensis TaxID=31243 RepID=A0A914IBH4_GLORO
MFLYVKYILGAGSSTSTIFCVSIINRNSPSPPPAPIEGENPFNSDEPSGDDDSSVVPLNDLDRDHRRPQLNGGGISSSSATSSSSASKSSVSTNPARRAPDMQMGKCPWVRVYDNVTYIVSAIALRDGPRGREVLLMREAKEKCRGKWYMPAGHVEPGETLEEACKRELREETGLECAVETLLCVEVRGSGWYRMAFAVEPNGGELKQEPDQESLGAGWHPLELVRRKRNDADGLQLRCRDFMSILAEAERYADWKRRMGLRGISAALPWAPILNRDEAQPGLFVDFVIVRQSVVSNRLECLVHQCVRDQLQLLDELTLPDAFPSVEFGFEFFLPSVITKVYRHVLDDGHCVLELPEAVTALWCLPAPMSSVRHGIRLRLLCRHKRSAQRGQILAPQRYRWIELDHPEVLSTLYLLDEQFRPKLFLL